MKRKYIFSKGIHLLICLLPFAFFGINCSCGSSNNIGEGFTYPPPPAEYTMRIDQHGITWYFNKDYETGRFANGDHWVVDPGTGVNIIYIYPPSVVENSRTINGSMINPSPGTGNVQGYDSSMAANDYDATINAARPDSQILSEVNPLIVYANSSLISSESIMEPGNRPQLKTAAILTVLSSPPAAQDSFRPPYCGSDKAITHNASELNFSLLLSLEPVQSTPELAEVERYFERPWIDHIPGWSAGLQHPEDNMPNYGREISTRVGIGALMLHLYFPDENAKRTLLIRYVQLGIDLYGIIRDSGTNNWHPDGGHASGRKWPILFAGLVLNDADMMAIGQKSGAYLFSGSNGPGNPAPDYIHFGEDGQTFRVEQEDVDRVHVPNWEDIVGISYLESDIGMPEWGICYSTYPGINNKDWQASYRLCCTALSWNGFVLATRIMNARTLWNHQPLFDYMDRYMAIANGDPDPFGFSVPNEEYGWRSASGFTADMWNKYRAVY